MSKSNIKYAKDDVIEGELNYSDAKVKVSMMLDGDLLLAVKKHAEKNHLKYQTLINTTLRQVFLKESQGIDPKDYAKLKKRVALLEKAILNPRAG